MGAISKVKKFFDFDQFNESKIKHNIDIVHEGHRIFLTLDVSGHTLKERIPRQLFEKSDEHIDHEIHLLTKKLAEKAFKKGLLTDE